MPDLDRRTALPDGLYQVTRVRVMRHPMMLCAGFSVRGGRIEFCAPALKRAFAFWEAVAVRVR